MLWVEASWCRRSDQDEGVRVMEGFVGDEEHLELDSLPLEVLKGDVVSGGAGRADRELSSGCIVLF